MRFSPLAVAITVFSTAPMTAIAASDAVCRAYADTAVQQNAANRRNDCGFSGLRWHGDDGGHFLFCKLADEADVNAETARRSAMLDGCLGETAEDAPEQEPQFERERPQVAGDGDGPALNLEAVETPQLQLAPNTQAESLNLQAVETPGLQVQLGGPDCKARRVSLSHTHESVSEARRVALLEWEVAVLRAYGEAYADPSSAREAALTCADPVNGQTTCTISGYPCAE